MQATSIDACRSHICGAAKMFEIVDPRQCAEGVLCQIFFHIRTQMTFLLLISDGRSTPIDVWRIVHNALTYDELPPFQRLNSHITALAEMCTNLYGTEELDAKDLPVHSTDLLTQI